MKTLFLIAITAMVTWFAAVGVAGKSGFKEAHNQGYIRGVSDLAENLTSQWGAIGKSEEVRLTATRLMTHAAEAAKVTEPTGRPFITGSAR
jgi:hypothetical protein